MPAVSQACPGRKAADRSHPPQSRASWLASSGRSQNRCMRSKRLIRVTLTHTKPREVTFQAKTHPKLSKAGGAVTARRTLVSTTSRNIIRRWPLDRGSSATHHRSGGNQPAHQSMINRRLLFVSPALPIIGDAEQV